MAEQLARKLAVILHADVVGSTALVQLNETLAHQRIQDTFRRFSETISSHSGVAHEIRGDALVAEFARASDAVGASLAFQAANTAHNEELPDEVCPVVRIGIAIGEVVIADSTVTGEGVVLAQRLEELAEPGGVCIQGAAYETVPKRLPFNYDSFGEQTLKGFAEPVRAYGVTLKAGEGIPAPDSVDQLEKPTWKRPDKPSIAVLPFMNMSGDPEQEYFSDGITEDTITALSYCRAFPVIARNSSFAFKGSLVRVQEVAQELGARYVLEGSLRKADNRIRVTAQLIDGETGHHLWAEKYDCAFQDICDLQDELTQRIASTVEPELAKAELQKSVTGRPDDLHAWDFFLRGMASIHKETIPDNAAARAMFQKAIDLEPGYGEAWAGLGLGFFRDISRHGEELRQGLLDKGFEAARRAVECDDSSALARYVLGTAYVWAGEIELAIAQVEESLKLNPYFARAHMALGNRLDLAGHTDSGIEKMEMSLELNPRDPGRADYMAYLARAYTSKGEYENALSRIERAVNLRPQDADLRYRLAVCLGNLDRPNEARAALAECEMLQPGSVAERSSWRPYSDDERNERFFRGLRKHGLIS